MLLMLCFLLTACEESSDKNTSGGSQFKLVRPQQSVVLDLDGEELSILYHGAATPDNLSIMLNGVPCTNDVNSLCFVSFIRSHGIAKARLDSLTSVLIPGENTIVVSNTDTGYTETLTFYFDNQAPKLEVTDVTGGSGINGIPMPGDTIIVSGRLVDPSPIQSVRLIVSGTVVNLTAVADTVLGINQFTNTLNVDGDRTFRAEVTWPDNTDSAPQIIYAVTDVYEQVSEEAFIVTGTMLNKSGALQINNSMYDAITVLADPFMQNALDFLEQYDQIDPLFADTIQPFVGQFCDFLMKTNKCTGEVVDVRIKKPELTIKGLSNAKLRAGLWFDLVDVKFRIYGYNCSGADEPGDASCPTAAGYFETTMRLDDFSVFSDFTLSPAVGSQFVTVAREPQVRINLEGFLNKQAILLGSTCPGSVCSINPSLLEFGYNLRLTAEGREMAADVLTGITSEINNMLISPSALVDTLIADVNACPAALPTEPRCSFDDLVSQFAPSLFIGDSLPLTLSGIGSASQNLHLNAETDTSSLLDLGTLLPADAAEKINKLAFGSVYSNQNGYSAVKNRSYPSKMPGYGAPRIDLAFAISANTVNQYLLDIHQSSSLSGKSMEISGTDLLADLGLPGADDVCLRFSTEAAPAVKFEGYKSTKAGFTFELVGIGEIGTIRDDRPGNVRLVADNLVVDIMDAGCVNSITSLPVDAEIHVSVNLVSGMPDVQPYQEFVMVRPRYPLQSYTVNGSAAEPSATLIASTVATLLENKLQQALTEFNSPQGKYKNAFELFSAFQGQVVCINTSTNAVSVPSGGSCAPGETALDVDELMVDFLSMPTNTLPREYGVAFSSFGIEPSGGYFTTMFRVERNKLSSASCPGKNSTDATYVPTQAKYFRGLCIDR